MDLRPQFFPADVSLTRADTWVGGGRMKRSTDESPETGRLEPMLGGPSCSEASFGGFAFEDNSSEGTF
eukprot:12981295-Alexandrium_andersonii.AAC.1